MKYDVYKLILQLDGRSAIKPCWYIDALGTKCGNKGISVDVLESTLLDEIRIYNLRPVISFDSEDNEEEEDFQASIPEKEALLQKQKKGSRASK